MPSELIERIIRSLGMEDEKNKAYGYMCHMVNDVLESERATEFAELFLVSLYNSYDKSSRRGYMGAFKDQIISGVRQTFLNEADGWKE